MKKALSIYSTTQEVYIRVNKIISQDQMGEVVMFKRRKENEGNLSELKTLEQVYS